jgi:hypothetical protein
MNSNTHTYKTHLATLMTRLCNPIHEQHQQQPQLLGGALQDMPRGGLPAGAAATAAATAGPAASSRPSPLGP